MLPLAAENLSMEEWGALPGHGMANFHGDKIWLILGLIRERMNDEQRAGDARAHAAAGGRDVDRLRRAGLQGLLRGGDGGGRRRLDALPRGRMLPGRRPAPLLHFGRATRNDSVRSTSTGSTREELPALLGQASGHLLRHRRRGRPPAGLSDLRRAGPTPTCPRADTFSVQARHRRRADRRRAFARLAGAPSPGSSRPASRSCTPIS